MIGLVDIDSKISNLVLMKLSTHFKSLGEEVKLISLPGCCRKTFKNGDVRKIAENVNKYYDKVFASAVFTRSQPVIDILNEICGDKIEVGGIGSYEPRKTLSPEIESLKPDYDLYCVDDIVKRMNGIGSKAHKYAKAKEIVEAGHGYTSRGCIRNCAFCLVPKCEGKFRQVSDISSLLNPKSNVLVLHDNNLTADPDCILKLNEIRDRKLILDLNQGCDARLMTDDIAHAMSEVKHLRSLHYAWDLMDFENQVIEGIKTLSKYIKPYKHMCFMLVGFNTSFEEDMYRFRKLLELKVKPFVMIYNENEAGNLKLKHFARWVNSSIYTTCNFDEYRPWQDVINSGSEQMQLAF